MLNKVNCRKRKSIQMPEPGDKFGRWTVIRQAEASSKDGRKMAECKCECGVVRNVILKNLYSGGSISCGCYKNEVQHVLGLKNEIGNRYGSVTVIGESNNRIDNRATWVVKCDCGEVFLMSGKQLRKNKFPGCRTCSLKQEKMARRNDYTGIRSGKWIIIGRSKRNPRYSICLCDCGTIKEVHTGSILRKASLSCGCYQKETSKTLEHRIRLSARLQGVSISEWQGFLSNKRQKDMDSSEYKEWRTSVFTRDNYTCARCGKRSVKGSEVVLCAHHLDSYSTHPEKRLDVNNGITLCNECHHPSISGSFHNLYGTVKNTKEQFSEYMMVS